MKITTFIILCITMISSMTAFAQPQVIAHRGYWKTNGSAQNSIRSLVKADSINCYGSEFDVWMTIDGELVVNHDAKVDNFIIEQSESADILSIKLDNGENISSLKQYLEEGQNCKTRLIFELKPHVNKILEAKAAIESIMLVNKMGLSNRVEYITFSPEALYLLIKYAPQGTPVYYLNGDKTPQELHKMGAAGMDYHYSILKKHPEWIEECHNLGMKVNAWTVNKEEDMIWCIKHNIDFITTNEPELLQNLLMSK